MGSMVQINELVGGETSPQSFNQATRWVMTKEEHASKIIKLISEYCLCQRVKAEVFQTSKDYTDALLAHHAVMKVKQSVDTSMCDALDHAVGDFAKMYIKA